MTLKTSGEASVRVFQIDRAAAGNALDIETQFELATALGEFESDDSYKVAVVCGAGEVFSIGHDREELLANASGLLAPSEMLPLFLTKPVIAAVEGPCYGLGFELALACDLRVAAEGSFFGFPDRNLFASYRTASVLLPRMTFLGMAEELLLTGRVLNPHEASAARLVAEITPRGDALARALAIGQRLAQQETASLHKQQIWQATGRPLSDAMHLVRNGML